MSLRVEGSPTYKALPPPSTTAPNTSSFLAGAWSIIQNIFTEESIREIRIFKVENDVTLSALDLAYPEHLAPFLKGVTKLTVRAQDITSWENLPFPEHITHLEIRGYTGSWKGLQLPKDLKDLTIWRCQAPFKDLILPKDLERLTISENPTHSLAGLRLRAKVQRLLLQNYQSTLQGVVFLTQPKKALFISGYTGSLIGSQVNPEALIFRTNVKGCYPIDFEKKKQ